MSIKFEKIEPGMTLLDIRREPMGNTTMRQWGCWKVQIVSVDKEKRTAVVRWNGNQPSAWDRSRLQRLYVKETKAYREQQERRRRS